MASLEKAKLKVEKDATSLAVALRASQEKHASVVKTYEDLRLDLEEIFLVSFFLLSPDSSIFV